LVIPHTGGAEIFASRKVILNVKPRPNDRSTSTQHIATLFGFNMLRAFGHRVAMCFAMSGVVGSSLKMITFKLTKPNTSQHVATGWPNARSMLHQTMM